MYDEYVEMDFSGSREGGKEGRREGGKEGRMIFELKAVAEKVEFCVLSERRRSSCMHD